MELETQTTDGVEDVVGDSSPTDAPTADGNESRQPEQPTEQQKVNLDELDEFRQWKSKMDQNLSVAQQQAQAAQAEAARLKAERDAAKMEKMSDEDRLRYELEQTRAELGSYRQQSEQQILMSQKEQQIAQIMAQTGVPREAIEQAESPSEAWGIGLDYFKTQSGKVQQEAQRRETVAANSTDIGGGSPPPAKNVSARVREAQEAGDMAAIYDAYMADS